MRTLTKLIGLCVIPATLAAQADLTGAGATFPYPIYSKWFADYAAQTNVKDGTALSDIFLGKVRKWNDGKIAKLNPGVSLPARDILVIHRSDASGTTYIFTDFISSVSKEWLAGPGRSKEVAWPIGLGGKGNDGVAGQVKQIPGAIGYVELAYARQNKLAFAAIKNAAGTFVAPSVESATAAAEGVAAKLNPKTDYRISIANAPGPAAYPITSFTWLLVYQDQTDPIKGKKLVDFMRWALTSGQASAAPLDYAPLPKAIADRLVERLGSIRMAGAAAPQ